MRYNRHMNLRPLQILLYITAIVSMAGCGGDSLDRPFETYLDRLGRTLEQEAHSASPAPPIFRRPRTSQLRIDIAPDKLGALDFLDLRGCELQVTVGKRNSSLGKLARDSQRLLLELEYLRLAPPCVAWLREQGDTTLAEQLEQSWHRKKRQLPAVIFNATLANEEFQQFWKPNRPAPEYPDNTASTVISALETIDALALQWLSGDYRADNLEFEILLYRVSTGDGGTLWRSLAHQQAWLGAANQLVQQRQAQGPLCGPQLRPQAADILPVVIRKFFIDGIQPRAAQLGQRQYQLLAPVSSLESRLSETLPPDYVRWQTARDADLEQLTGAPMRHVIQLQKILESCEQ